MKLLCQVDGEWISSEQEHYDGNNSDNGRDVPSPSLRGNHPGKILGGLFGFLLFKVRCQVECT